MRRKAEEACKRMNTLIWLVIDSTRKISRIEVNSYTRGGNALGRQGN